MAEDDEDFHTMRAQRQHIVTRASATSWAHALGKLAFSQRLRVLAYHDITHPGRFRAQMSWVTQHFSVVTGRDVARALDGDEPLPRLPVWITFDDGHPAVAREGMPILAELGISATMYICPGFVDTSAPYWWDIIERATRVGIPLPDGLAGKANPVATLKVWPDERRREFVDELEQRVVHHSRQPTRRRHLTRQELRDWLAAGHEVGSHSWDHPCLDQCTPTIQERQVRLAHEWFLDQVPGWFPQFAYPNGNWTSHTERILLECGYRTASLFDHRLASRTDHPLRISRLRVSADAPMARFRAIMSGWHPVLFSLRSGRGSGTFGRPR